MGQTEDIRRAVRDRYASIARSTRSRTEAGCCAPRAATSCCPSAGATVGTAIGYTQEDLATAPEGANLGLGCGNPVAIAELRQGETVLDLGSGAGFDCFLAAKRVGPTGRVIGVDMTPDMIDAARANAERGAFANVEFRLGEIEHLPVADNSVDVILSNCVVNLVPDKAQAFREAHRVLREGGRMMISDLVTLAPLDARIASSINAWVGCIAGGAPKDRYLSAIREAGFCDVTVVEETTFAGLAEALAPDGARLAESWGLTPEDIQAAAASIASVRVRAVKRR